MKIQEVILKAMSGKLKWWEAAEIIGITDGTTLRWRDQYEEHGYSGLWDHRKGQPSPKRVPVKELETVLHLYRERYFDLNVLHFHEKLRDEHDIHFSYTWVKTALQEAGLVKRRKKPGSHRKRRPRRSLPGMMLHIDGSEHRWFQDERRPELLVIMDDATSEIYYAQLVEAESTRSVMAALREVIETRGVFCTLYSDRAGHFFHTQKAGGKVDRTRPTQVGRALGELLIKTIAAYSPEARGRSERGFGTWQGRLPQELRLNGITDMAGANEFLRDRYIAGFNNKFRVDNRVFQIEKARWRNTLAGQNAIVHDGRVSIRYGAHLIAEAAAGQLPPQAPRRKGKARPPGPPRTGKPSDNPKPVVRGKSRLASSK